jgi:hypothetical protein
MGRDKGSKGKEVETVDLTEDEPAPPVPAPGGASGAGSSKPKKPKKRKTEEPSSQSTDDGVCITGVTPAPAPTQAPARQQHHTHQGPQRFDDELGTQAPDDEGDELAQLVCFGAFSTKIVGIQYYSGIVSR